MRKFDVLVLGATGFTGKFVARDLMKLSETKSTLRWAMAGRSRSKLEETLAWVKETAGSFYEPDLVLADAGDAQSLLDAAASATVLINCVGPFRFTGVDVVKTCIAAGTHYVDITGEPEFIERIWQLNEEAKEKAVTVVPSCGFDSIPADMGNLFIKQQFQNKGYSAASVEMFLQITSGPEGIVGNYATYESAVEGISNVDKLRSLRKIAGRAPLPMFGKRLQLFNNARFEPRVGKWCIPFFGADASVVRLSQQVVERLRTTGFAKGFEVPTQFNAYFCSQSVLGVAGLLFFGLSMTLLSQFQFGKKLLLKYPGFFSFGVFSKKGPTAAQLSQTGFISTFYSTGFKKPLQVEDSSTMSKQSLPNYQMKVVVQGPEPGYVATPIAVIACALQIVHDVKSASGKIPHGVMPPAAAFAKTNLIEELNRNGIIFRVEEEGDL